MDKSFEKIEKKWFKKWKKKFPEDIKKIEEDFQIPKEFEEKLEQLTERYANRLLIPKENEESGSFTEYSDFEKINGVE